jgi:PAS domain S-box-containing protein
MEFLRRLLRINNVVPTETVRAMSGYSLIVILAGVVLIISLWLFVWQQLSYDYDRKMEETSKETMNLTKAFEEHVRRIVANADRDLLKLKQACEREGISSPVVTAYMEAVATDPAINQVVIINEQGIVDASLIEGTVGTDVSDREYFQVHRDTVTETLDIGTTIIGKTTRESSIPLSRRVNKPDGSFGGAVYIGLKTDYFLSFYKQMDLGPDQLVFLTGMDGFVRARQTGDHSQSGQDVRAGQAWKRAQTGSLAGTYIGCTLLDGIYRVLSYRVMPDYPLIISVSKSTEVALAPFEKRKQGTILVASLVSLFIVVICGLLVDRVAKQRALNTELERLVREKTRELQIEHKVLQKREEDLSEVNRKLIETSAAVQTEKDRLSSLINSISDEVWFADTKKRVILANPTAAQEFLLGDGVIEVEKLIASVEMLRPDGSPRPVEEAPPLRALRGETIRNQQEIIRTPASGELRHREISSTPVRDAAGTIIGSVSVARDITERKAMEEEIKRHRDNLQALVQEQVREIHQINTEMVAILGSISDPFFVLDKEWRLMYINKEAAQSADLRLNETHIGQNIWAVLPELVGGELYRKSHKACTDNIPTNTIFKSLVSERLFDTRLYPYANGLLVCLRDITEQKKYEAELLRLDRLNIIGETAAGIGHEVRNPMTTVRGYLQRFARIAAFAEYHEPLALMIEELDRANTIISDFLSLAKNKTVNMKSTDLNTVIRSLFPLLQADAFRRGSTIELELHDIPEIVADEKELRQCILNLVGNGLDAMPEGGKVTIGTANTKDRVEMTVRDRGTGIPPAIKDKLGTPFFTTKEHGTGLGLPVCYQIAQRHHANLEVETGPKGTAFHFIFRLNEQYD